MITLIESVKKECCNYTNRQCLGVGMDGRRFKDEQGSEIYYQYPYMLKRESTGRCSIEDGEMCSFFAKCVLPRHPEMIDSYNELNMDALLVKSKVCKCGNSVHINERKCVSCKKKTRNLRNKRFRRDG